MGLLVTEAVLVFQDQLDLLDLEVCKGLKESAEMLDHQARKGHLVHLECKDLQDLLDNGVNEERKDLLASMDLPDLVDDQVTRDPLDLQV